MSEILNFTKGSASGKNKGIGKLFMVKVFYSYLIKLYLDISIDNSNFSKQKNHRLCPLFSYSRGEFSVPSFVLWLLTHFASVL
jgi:hypothetical protein